MNAGTEALGPGLVMLDRDGVINRDSDNFIRSPDDWQPLPGSIEALAKLSAAGMRLVVVTNQSGVGRGLFSADTLENIHARMRETIEAAGGQLDGIYFCPHHPDEGCSCRKPAPGLLHEVADDFGDLRNRPLIGDSARDLEAAMAVGARPVLVRTGKGRSTEAGWDGELEVYEDLAAAAAALLGEDR